jgi:sugar transferase (PEP-CTERM/EpsH1 system associated)
MRILWVKVGGLWPPHMGGRLRSFHLISELSRRHRVTVLTTHGPGDDPAGLAAALPACEEVLSVPFAIPKQGTARFALALLRSWLSSSPVDMLKCRVPALRSQAGRILATGVDICIADFLFAAANVPTNTPTPVILFEHNVEHMIWKRLRDVERFAWRRALLELECRKMRRYEARACAKADLTLAVSDADRELLETSAPMATIRTIPTGVDTEYFHPNDSEEIPASLVFTGAMDWYPNEDAMLYFIDAILPAIRRSVPAISLSVVGRNPSERLRSIAVRAGVHVTGTVEDVRPHVARAAVCVVPLRVGGGTRLKIFEALAMGKAIVSTTIGAEGLPVVSGRHLLLADGVEHFAHAVASLVRDANRRQQLGCAGRRLVEERYSWARVTEDFETHCEHSLRRG